MLCSRANRSVSFLLSLIVCIFAGHSESKAAEQVCASHILTETRSGAHRVISFLNDGANFEDLAREFSRGPSGPNGGKLGCFSRGQMVQPFEDAAFGMPIGSYSASPLQTEFGWHVIQITDKNNDGYEPPKPESKFNPLRPRQVGARDDLPELTHIEGQISLVLDATINDLQIRIVRFAKDFVATSMISACVSDDLEMLEVSGPIGPDSTAVVSRVIDRLKPCYDANGNKVPNIVALSSGGGLLADGLMLGEMIRSRGLDTTVLAGTYCASSCTIAFMGGTRRTMARQATLMFHSPYTVEREATKVVLDCSDKEVADFLNKYYSLMLGKADGQFVFERTMAYCGETEGWFLNRDAASIFGIVNESPSPIREWN